jgi:nucleotide-binding universal stress UspA family protein
MFKKIVWATDGSENSERALEYLKSLALEAGASVVVAHCEEILMSIGRGGPQLDPGDTELNHPKIAEQVQELKAAGVDVTVRRGTAPAGASGVAHVISEIAKEEGADLIATGRHGHSSLGALVGSVTQRLLAIAECPVLVIPHKAA